MRISTFLPVLAVMVLLSSCGPYVYVPTSVEQSNLHDLSTAPHQRNVEIYFAGESQPAKPYIHLKLLSVQKRGFNDLNQMVLDLKKQGQANGADAIIILDRYKNIHEEFDDGNPGTVETATMDALAVAYTESLKYEPGRVKACKLYRPVPGSEEWKLVAMQSFDYRGQPLAVSDSKGWINWWHNWNHQYLMETPAALVGTARDGYNRENKRILNNNIKVNIHYSKQGKDQINKLRIVVNNMPYAQVFYHYQPDGKQIAYREMMMANEFSTRYREEVELGEDGQLKGYRFVKKDTAGETPHLRVEYEYYSEADWAARVKELTIAAANK